MGGNEKQRAARRPLPGRRLILGIGTLALLAASGGAAYAFGPSAEARLGSPRQKQVLSTIDPSALAGSAPLGSGPTGPPAGTSGTGGSSVAGTPEPAGTSGTPETTTVAADTGSCPAGEHQREVEAHLSAIGGFGQVRIDGFQSDQDCAAIKGFQARFGISPASGRPGELTVNVARRIALSIDAVRNGSCGAPPTGLAFCVDLTHQTVWAVRNGILVFGPTVTRTGMPGYATTAGTYRIYDRSVRSWSKPYQVWLPYWQNFNAGMGFHETTTYLHAMGMGSHGCVNLLHDDAVALWNLGGLGVTVRVFGRRPGT